MDGRIYTPYVITLLCITDTYVHQYMTPRRVITIYTWGGNSANPKALTYVRGRVQARVRVREKNCEQKMNKL